MKKLCTALIAIALVVLCLFALPTKANAADAAYKGKCGDNVTWELHSDGTLVISGSGSMYNFTKWGMLGFFGFEAPWEACSNRIRSVVISEGVTSIGEGAFWGCANLTTMSIPKSVRYIGDAAFENCTSLRDVYIADLAAWCAIDFYDFDSNPMYQAENLYVNGEPVTELEIPTSVKSIQEFAFYSCESLNSVTIPTGVTAIGERSFASCTNLTKIQVAAGNVYYSSDAQGVLYNKTKTVLIQAPGALTSCVIPNGVTEIGEYAFRSCASLRTVTIPESVTDIGGYAFNYCHGLRGVYISDLAAWCRINFGSFSANPLNYANILYVNNKAVTELVIPEGITEIKNFAFFNCKSLTGVTIPEGVTDIGDKAFYNCLNVTSVTIPVSMKNIGEEAFYNCVALEKVFYCAGNMAWEAINVHSSNTYLLNAVIDHDWDGYVCRICGYERVDESLVYYGAPSLSFQDYIGMQILIRNGDVSKYDSVYVIAEQETPNGIVKTKLEGIPFYGAYQVFDHQVVSWSMTEDVTMILCGEVDGKVYRGATLTGSVQSLAMQMILKYAASDADNCRVLVDMLNYGAAVQSLFNYNADKLANAELGELAAFGTAEKPAFAATNVIAGTGKVKVLVDNISLQSKVEIQLLFSADISAYTAKATVNGSETVVILDKTSYAEYGWTLLRVPIKANQMRDTFTVALYDADGNPVTQVYNVSAEGYATARLNSTYHALDVALMRYGDSVKKL